MSAYPAHTAPILHTARTVAHCGEERQEDWKCRVENGRSSRLRDTVLGRKEICYHHVRMPVCPDPIRLLLLSAVILL